MPYGGPTNFTLLARNDAVIANANQAVTIDFLGNDDTPNGPANVTISFDSTTLGTLSLNADKTFLFTPNQDISGVESVRYILQNNADDQISMAWVTIAIDPHPLYTQAMMAADQVYRDAVITAVNARDTDISTSREATQQLANAAYSEYLGAVDLEFIEFVSRENTAGQQYLANMEQPKDVYEEAVEVARISLESARNAAWTNFSTQAEQADSDYASAVAIADSAYDNAISPYRIACDLAVAEHEADPADETKLTALHEAESALATATQDAEAVRERARAEAAAAQKLALDSAMEEYDDALSHADNQHTETVNEAWQDRATNTGNFEIIFTELRAAAWADFQSHETSMWETYTNRIIELEAAQRAYEEGAQATFDEAVTNALAEDWSFTEVSAWNDYQTALAAAPGVAEGARILAPTAVEVEPISEYAGIEQQPRSEQAQNPLPPYQGFVFFADSVSTSLTEGLAAGWYDAAALRNLIQLFGAGTGFALLSLEGCRQVEQRVGVVSNLPERTRAVCDAFARDPKSAAAKKALDDLVKVLEKERDAINKALAEVKKQYDGGVDPFKAEKAKKIKELEEKLKRLADEYLEASKVQKDGKAQPPKIE